MTPVQLQRVVVRMLFDPAFVGRVYAGEAELEPGDRDLLVAVDRRAWGTDPYRRPRALTALLEEYPASAALAGVHRLDAFFSSEGFHAGIMERTALFESFGRWIGALAGSVARLELAVAQARRDQERSPTPWILAPGVVPVEVEQGTLARWQWLRARLGSSPVERLARGGVDLRDLPPVGGTEHLLVEPGPQGLGVGEIPPALYALLVSARHSLGREALLAAVRKLGVDRGEDAEIVDGLVKDGLITGS